LENLNQSAKQRHQRYLKQKYAQSARLKEEPVSQKAFDTTPFTVEKGINAIKRDSTQSSQERRPKLKREFSMGSESDLEILPIDADIRDIDSRNYRQMPISSTSMKESRVRAPVSSSTANYLSLV